MEFLAKEFEEENYVKVWTKGRWKKEVKGIRAEEQTMYKRKDKKVNLINMPLPDGINPGGGFNPCHIWGGLYHEGHV